MSSTSPTSKTTSSQPVKPSTKPVKKSAAKTSKEKKPDYYDPIPAISIQDLKDVKTRLAWLKRVDPNLYNAFYWSHRGVDNLNQEAKQAVIWYLARFAQLFQGKKFKSDPIYISLYKTMLHQVATEIAQKIELSRDSEFDRIILKKEPLVICLRYSLNYLEKIALKNKIPERFSIFSSFLPLSEIAGSHTSILKSKKLSVLLAKAQIYLYERNIQIDDGLVKFFQNQFFILSQIFNDHKKTAIRLAKLLSKSLPILLHQLEQIEGYQSGLARDVLLTALVTSNGIKQCLQNLILLKHFALRFLERGEAYTHQIFRNFIEQDTFEINQKNLSLILKFHDLTGVVNFSRFIVKGDDPLARIKLMLRHLDPRQFKKREVALLILPKDGGWLIDSFANNLPKILNVLLKNYKVIVLSASKHTSYLAAVQHSYKITRKQAGFVLIAGHGDPHNISFGGVWRIGKIKIASRKKTTYPIQTPDLNNESLNMQHETIIQASRPYIARDASIVMYSCSTGKLGGIADFYSKNIPGRRIFAGTMPHSGISPTSIQLYRNANKNLRIQTLHFFKDEETIQTRQICTPSLNYPCLK